MNSVKKTENGFIEFNIDTIEKYDVCRVIFRITDSGVGIGIDKINEILSVTSELDKDDIVKEITSYHQLDYYNDKDYDDLEIDI